MMERTLRKTSSHYRQYRYDKQSLTVTRRNLTTLQLFISVSLIVLCRLNGSVASPVPNKLTRVPRSVEGSSHSVTFTASTQTFSEELRSPCKSPLPSNPADLRNHGLTTGYLINKTNGVLHYVDGATKLWNGCPNTTYPFNLDTPLPTPDQLLNMTFVEAIETIYEVLVIHTSYVYHMYHQENASTEHCSDRPDGARVARVFQYIFANTQDLMCDIKVSNPTAQLDRATSNGLLRAELTTDSRCSTRINRDCLVAKSFQKVLGPIISFLERHNQREMARTSR